MSFGLINTVIILIAAGIIGWAAWQFQLIRFFKKGGSAFLMGILLASILLNVFATGGQFAIWGATDIPTQMGGTVTLVIAYEPPPGDASTWDVQYDLYAGVEGTGQTMATLVKTGNFTARVNEKTTVTLYTISPVTFSRPKMYSASIIAKPYGANHDNGAFWQHETIHMLITPIGPTIPIEKDSDDDSFPDSYDSCPTLSGTCGGCPCDTIQGVPINQDSDNDGIRDIDDSCPYVEGVMTNGGCPVSDTSGLPPDNDDDGIPDSSDNCPTQPGPWSNDGCPVPTNPIVKPEAFFDYTMSDYLGDTYVVNFTNQSSGEVTTYTWKVNGVTKSNANDFMFMFDRDQGYEIELIAEGPGGTDSHMVYLVLNSPPEEDNEPPCACDCAPLLDRRVVDLSSTGMVVEYTDNSSGNITYRKWIKNGTVLFEETGASSYTMNLSAGQKYTIQLEVGNGTCNKTYTINEDLTNLSGGSLSLFGGSFSIEGAAMILAGLLFVIYLLINRGRV